MKAVLGRWGTANLCVAMAVFLVTARPALAQVGQRPVQLTAVASAGAGAGEFFDVATLRGGDSPAGTLTFRLFGPGDDTCSLAPVFTSVKPVGGAGTEPVTVESDHVFLASPGVYRWVASYSGDAVHAPAGPTGCGDIDQAVGFGSSSFAFSAQASPATTVGGTLFDTATIASASTPTGTLTFRLFGPEDPGCAGTPILTWTMPVNGDGAYRSGAYPAPRPGLYTWVAAYSGDADHPGAETPCGDPSQKVEVAPAASVSAPGCAVVAPQLASVDGRMRALRQQLSAFLDPATMALVDRAVADTRWPMPCG